MLASLALVLGPVFVCHAAAQEPPLTGSRLGAAPATGLRVLPEEVGGSIGARSPELARRAAFGAAGCMAETHAKDVKTYLLGGKKASNFDRWLSYCLGAKTLGMTNGTMSLPGTLWYGTLAESYIKRQHAALPTVLPVRVDYSASWMSSDPSTNVVQQMAACLSDTQPQMVNAIFATAPGSAAESAALNGLGKYISPCLVQNATLRTNAAGLRAALAGAYFHRAFDTPAPSTTEKR